MFENFIKKFKHLTAIKYKDSIADFFKVRKLLEATTNKKAKKLISS